MLFGFSACSKKTNKEGRYVPSNASFVLHINGASLSEKLPWSEVKNNEGWKKLYADSTVPAEVKKIMDDPANSGIDTKKDLMIFMVKDSLGEYAGIEGSLLNEKTFSDFINDASKNQLVITDKNGIKTGETTKMALTWNNDRFVIIAANGYKFGDLNPAGRNYSSEKNDYAKVSKAVFNLEESKSLGDDEKFSKLMSDKGDIHFWVNSEEIYKSDANAGLQMGPLSMLNFTKIIKDARTTGTVKFENGKIVADLKSFSNKDMQKLIEKYWSSKGDANMIKNIPSENLGLLVAVSFNPEFIKEYMKLLGAEGLANMGSSMLGFTLDDFIKATKGDFAVAINNLKMDSTGKPEINVIGAMSINDKTSFEKLLGAVNKTALQMSKYDSAAKPPFYYNKSEKYFAIGSNQGSVDAFLSGNKSNTSAIKDKYIENGSLFYVNIQYLMNGFAAKAKDSADQAMLAASQQIWDNMIAYGQGVHSGVGEAHIEINMIDKNTNSLKQLNTYFNKVALIEATRKKEAYSLQDYPTDTLSVKMEK
jgi:hypothetical protein